MAGAVYWFICTNSTNSSPIPVVAGSQKTFNRQTANAIAGLSKLRHQVGDLLPRPTSAAVNNHLLCDGSAISRTAFPTLFAEIGTEWGVGDGSTTFNIPNLVGAAIPNATTSPPQTITDTTVSTGATVVEPATPGETGGTRGGNVLSGGRTRAAIE
jgi:hypothetical protein